MDIEKVGQAISYLRKKAGFTQKDLAERLGITDKAVSKWERGSSLPDVSILGKLSIVLDTDVESILAGDVASHRPGWCGLLYLKENACNIGLDTVIYDKPLGNFLIGYFLLMGIKTIVVASSKKDNEFIKSQYGDGSDLGVSIITCSSDVDSVMDVLPDDSDVMAVLDRTIIYGVDQTRFFQKAMAMPGRVTVLSLPKNGENQSKIVFDADKKMVDILNENQILTQYDYFEIPICFAPKEQISAICQGKAIDDEYLYAEVLDRGFVEITLSDKEDVKDASEFVRIVQKQCGMELYNLQEIAWRRGLLSQ